MNFEFTKRFAKLYDKAPKKVKKDFNDRLHLFIKNKFDPILNNHSLLGKCSGKRSINVTGDWRAIFSETKKDEIVYFEVLGTHSQLYN